jgi:hypothetical protein
MLFVLQRSENNSDRRTWGKAVKRDREGVMSLGQRNEERKINDEPKDESKGG